MTNVSVKVKICGITSVSDRDVAVRAGADAIGLMLYSGSPRHISLEAAHEIAATIPPHVMRVGVFVNPDPSDVFEAIRLCGLNLLQFHGDESPAFCQQFGVMTMKAFRIRNAGSLEALQSFGSEAFLLDSYVPDKVGGTGETFNWSLAVEAKKTWAGRFFLAGGLTSKNVADAIRTVQPFGVDVSSGVEFSPGKKDPEKVQAFIAAAHAALHETPAV